MNNQENNAFHILFVKERNILFLDNLKKLAGKFTHAEKLAFWFFSLLMAVSGILLALDASAEFTEEIPAHGGTFSEGMVGSPRFVNPLLAVSDTDKSLSALVYSGLLRPTKEGFAPDLAEWYEVSPDGLVYSVKIRDDAFFHDGRPVTADDVVFTIEKALDPSIKSPKRANWEGVLVEKSDDKHLVFTLKKPYYSFIENLILGILPKHVWEEAVPEEFPFSQWNIEPIGAGPYKIKSVKRNDSGIPTYMELVSWKKHPGGRAYITNFNVRFFRDEDKVVSAFIEGGLDGASGVAPASVDLLQKTGAQIISSPMSRIFGAFFNQNKAAVFSNSEVRKALNTSVDKQKMVDEILFGYGLPLDGPWPRRHAIATSTTDDARDMLAKAGWKLNNSGVLEKKVKSQFYALEFSISTGNVPELKKTADILKKTWEQLGAKVEIKIFESADLNRDVIRPRNYDVLLFGESLGREPDFYPFWHSSQRVDPGLNIALYTSITADKLIDEIRASTDREIRDEKLNKLANEIENDVPAVFTYAPELIYAVSPRIRNVSTIGGNASDRFSGIKNWYIETDHVWKIFTN